MMHMVVPVLPDKVNQTHHCKPEGSMPASAMEVVVLRYEVSGPISAAEKSEFM